MLDQQDQKFIQDAIGEGLKKAEANIIEAVGTMVEQNIIPQFDAIHTEIGGLHTEIGGLHTELGTIRAEMVTKEYLDDKLSDLRGDLVVLTRKEDTKLRELVTVLREKNILNDPEVKRVLAMEPFPQLIL